MSRRSPRPRTEGRAQSSELEGFVETYGNLLRAMADGGGSQEIIDAHKQRILFPLLSSESLSSEKRFAFGLAFKKLQRKADLLVVAQPSLELIRADLVHSLLQQQADRARGREVERDVTLSDQERESLVAIAESVSSQFPGCSVCVFDSYQLPTCTPNTRTRSAAVLWDGFASESWSIRFARLKKLSATHPFVLVGITPREVENNAFLGISSTIKGRPHRQIDASMIGALASANSRL
jgi:hypothetical protein